MFTSGFFNSINSDRKYNAEQMASIFDGLITDGIFDSIGDHFQVTPASSGLGVNIGTGRAWLNQTWSYNDTTYPVTLGAASPSLGRKDLICIKVDKSNAVRANSLVVIAGTPAASPVEPTVTDDTTNGIYYHKLAAVTVPKGATSISAANITNYIGLASGTPYVTGLLSSTTVDELWSQWDGEFNDWWDDIKATLDDNIVTTILNKIDHITPKEATMNLYGFSHINPPPSGMEYKEYSTDAILNQISSLINGIQIPIINKAELGEFTFSIENSAYQNKTANLISPFSKDIYLRSIGLYSIITRTGTYSSTADSYIGGYNSNNEDNGPVGKIKIEAGMPIDENIKFTRIDLFSSKNLYIYKNNTIFSISGNSPTSSASEYGIMGITNWTKVEYYYLGRNITGTDHLYLLYI